MSTKETGVAGSKAGSSEGGTAPAASSDGYVRIAFWIVITKGKIGLRGIPA